MIRLLGGILLMILISAPVFPQKLFSVYHIRYWSGDSSVIKFETLQRSKMYKLLAASNENSSSKIASIEDSDGRAFEFITYQDSSFLAEKLVEAPHALYSPTENNLYLRVNDSVYYHLYNKEMISEGQGHRSIRYKGLLLTLVGSDDDLKQKINKLKFSEEEIQDVVVGINRLKYPDSAIQKYKNVKNSRMYNSVMLHGGRLNKHTNIELDVHRIFYFPSLSNSMSLRTGFTMGYHAGEQSDGGTFHDYYLSIPGYANWEITNRIITPYFQGGILFAFVKEEDYGNRVGLSWILSGGLRIKPTSNFNIRIGAKTSLAGRNLDMGLEYIF